MNRTAARAALGAACAAAFLFAGCGRRAAPPAPANVAAIQAAVEAHRGKPVLLNFWATWCKPCVAELPGLVTLQADRHHDVHVIAVSLDGFLSGDATSVQVVEEFLKKTPSPFEHLVYRGTQDDLFAAFDLPGGIPFSILYDATGRAVRRFDGAAEPAEVLTALAQANGR